MTRRKISRIAAIAGVLGAIAALAIVLGRRAPSAEKASPAASSPPATSRPGPGIRPEKPPAEPQVAEEPADPIFTEAQVRGLSLDKAQRSLELYQETMIYPPWSRPFDGSTRHLAEWNKAWPAGQPFAADKDKREIRADLALDKLFAGPGESFTAVLAIAYVDTGMPVEVEEMSGRVDYYDDASRTWQRASAVTFTPAGHVYLASFAPSQVPLLAEQPREARFVAFVRIGEFPKELAQPFQYAAQSPLVVYGLAGDRVTPDGSLEVSLDVDVRFLAPTLVQAVLYDARGETGIAVFDDYIRPQTLGRQQVAIRFFGKAIRDRGLNGPYRIRALHGHVKVPGLAPPEVFWASSDEPPRMTHPWQSGQFSGDAWSSPEKDEKIAQYHKLMGDLSSGN